MAIAGASAVTAVTAAMSGANPVSFFFHDQVTAAFAKGGVLLDGNERNYMIHASRREKAGAAEVHIRLRVAGTGAFAPVEWARK